MSSEADAVDGDAAVQPPPLTQDQCDWASTFCRVKVGPGAAPASASGSGGKPKSGAAPSPKAARAEGAAKNVNDTSDADIANLSSKDQVALLRDLVGNGKPTGDVRKAQIKIFRNMKLDPGFQAREAARADKVADEIKDDPDVKASAKDWAGTSKDQKMKALKRLMIAQCKQLGIPVPPFEAYDKAPDAKGDVEDGNYNPHDGKMHFNTNPGANKTFTDAMDTIVHETSHAYQHDLVKRFTAGTLKPEDPDYAEAQMLEANDSDDNYIQPKEDGAGYVAQPEENHARVVAADYIDKINKKLTGPAPAAP